MRGEEAALGIGMTLYVLGPLFLLTRGRSIPWESYPVFLPTGLLALALLNRWVRSRVLGWGVFSLAFVFFLAVFGSLVMRMRAVPDVQWIWFCRALAMYAAFGMAGLYQLRGLRPGRSGRNLVQ